jgi:GNAT superfamily N-acetyltransferase
MEYELYLKYDGDLDLNINDYSGGIWETTFASIMYDSGNDIDESEEDEIEGTRIGFIHLLHINQVLAKTYGVNMAHQPFITLRKNSQALVELDHNLISQETIDEIGAASNPNIIVIIHFGISAAWRNKGLGEQVLKGIIKQMKGKYGYFMILNGIPEQLDKHTGPDSLYEIQGVELAGLEKDPEKAQFKLSSFFQRCGFRPFKNYDNVFVCNVDQAVPERIKAKHPENRFS